MYDRGLGVPRHFVEAAKWYRLAAERDNADGQFCLARLHAHGLGVPQDHAEVARLPALAAEKGHADARRVLASGD